VESAAVLQKFEREECDLAIIVGDLGTRDEIRLTDVPPVGSRNSAIGLCFNLTK
jgi:hypothetical protein